MRAPQLRFTCARRWPKTRGMNSAPPSISVIVPVHDVAGHVGACIESLRAQSFPDFEAIVVVDGPTDGSGAIARAAAGDDERFVFVEQENRGLGAARNAGLARARGDVIAFLDGDDRYAPEFLARMQAALTESGVDWVACGLRNVYPDGTTSTHSAIHGAPELADHPGAAFHALDDWPGIFRHFPSAWNKLYRRALIEGLAFDEGLWFEDHTFFARAALRSDRLLHLPEPLYWQTRGRAGQITATQSERVFDQIEVLERVAEIVMESNRPGRRAGLARLATRLTHERSQVLVDADLRARFATAARDFLARHGLRPDAGEDENPDEGIALCWAELLKGHPPLSVIVPSDGATEPLEATLAALAAQTLRDMELLVVADRSDPQIEAAARAAGARLLVQPGRGAGPARNHGLEAASGALVVFVDAGDILTPDALRMRAEAMLRAGADFGVSAFRVGIGGAVHPGLHDTQSWPPERLAGGEVVLTPADALALHAHPSAKILRRDFMGARGIRFGAGVLADWPVTLGAALAAGRALYFPEPDIESDEAPQARRLWRTPASAGALARAIADIARSLPQGAPPLPEGWQGRLFARAVWEQFHFAQRHDSRAVLGFLAQAAWLAGRRPLRPGPAGVDPYIEPGLRQLLGL